MSKFRCICGHLIDDSMYPSPHDFSVLSEAALNEALLKMGEVAHDLVRATEADREKVIRDKLGNDYPLHVSNAEVLEDLFSATVASKARSLLCCSSCGRLHLQKASGANEYAAYSPE